MSSTFPPEIEQFVQQELASGQYPNEQALLTAALEVYRELKQRHHDLRGRIQLSLEQAARGEVAPLDIDAIVAELNEELNESGQPA